MKRNELSWAWAGTVVVRVLLAAAIGCGVGVLGAWASFWASMKYFVYKYPHDGQDGLGALFVGLMGGAAGWVGGFLVAMWLQSQWLSRQRLEKKPSV